MEEFQYIICPIITWFVTGVIKFIINWYRSGFSKSLDLIGYGGFPSNHSAIVTSLLFLILLNEGYFSPAFGIAFTVWIITLMDAKSLRGQVAKHAIEINKFSKDKQKNNLMLRERIGHSTFEIFGGIFVGLIVALTVFTLLS